jgi:hypothetical protein
MGLLQPIGNDKHAYQIGNDPIYLVIEMIDGKPRMHFTIYATQEGEKLDPPQVLHLATFRSEDTGRVMIEWLDKMLKQVNDAIEHYHELHDRDKERALTQLQEPRRGEQN